MVKISSLSCDNVCCFHRESILNLREKNVDIQIEGENRTDDLMSKKIALLLQYGI